MKVTTTQCQRRSSLLHPAQSSVRRQYLKIKYKSRLDYPSYTALNTSLVHVTRKNRGQGPCHRIIDLLTSPRSKLCGEGKGHPVTHPSVRELRGFLRRVERLPSVETPDRLHQQVCCWQETVMAEHARKNMKLSIINGRIVQLASSCDSALKTTCAKARSALNVLLLYILTRGKKPSSMTHGNHQQGQIVSCAHQKALQQNERKDIPFSSPTALDGDPRHTMTPWPSSYNNRICTPHLR